VEDSGWKRSVLLPEAFLAEDVPAAAGVALLVATAPLEQLHANRADAQRRDVASAKQRHQIAG